MFILKELCTKEVEASKVKNSHQYIFELREKQMTPWKLPMKCYRKPSTADRKTKVRTFQLGHKILVLLPSDRNKLLMQWKVSTKLIL